MGAIPRIAVADLEPELAETLQPRIDRLGYLGEVFSATAHQPEALRAFMTFTEAAKDALPHDLTELVALTAATRLGNEYERHQHERLAVRRGLDRSWIAAVERLDPGDPALSPTQAATQRYVLTALASVGKEAAEPLSELDDMLGPSQAVAVLFLTGRFLAHALLANSLEVQPPVPSIFEDGFDGH